MLCVPHKTASVSEGTLSREVSRPSAPSRRVRSCPVPLHLRPVIWEKVRVRSGSIRSRRSGSIPLVSRPTFVQKLCRRGGRHSLPYKTKTAARLEQGRLPIQKILSHPAGKNFFFPGGKAFPTGNVCPRPRNARLSDRRAPLPLDPTKAVEPQKGTAPPCNCPTSDRFAKWGFGGFWRYYVCFRVEVPRSDPSLTERPMALISVLEEISKERQKRS
jgi:hypothetical protein